jgi:hypothetical protein
MNLVTKLNKKMAPKAEEFTAVPLTELVTDICELAGLIEQNWADDASVGNLIPQLESAVEALVHMADGRRIMRAFDGSGRVWYALND